MPRALPPAWHPQGQVEGDLESLSALADGFDAYLAAAAAESTAQAPSPRVCLKREKSAIWMEFAASFREEFAGFVALR